MRVAAETKSISAVPSRNENFLRRLIIIGTYQLLYYYSREMLIFNRVVYIYRQKSHIN